MNWNEFLHEAVAEEDIDLVRQALAEGADPNALGEDGSTPLYWAVSGGDVAIAHVLLKAGARVASDSQEAFCTFHAAVEDMNLPMVNLLLDYDGAAALNLFDYIDRTPLIIAVETENIPIVRRLLDAEADVNAHNEPRIGDTALYCAVKKGTLEIVMLLLKSGANPKIKGWMWRTPLDEARGRKRGDGPRIYELLEQAAKRFREQS